MNNRTLTVFLPSAEKRNGLAALLPFLLCIALWGAFLWMIGRVTLLPYAAIGALLAFCPLLGKHRRVVGGALPALLLLSLLLSRSISGGLAVLSNRLFAASEARQRYLYETFSASADSLVPAVLWGSALLALCFGWLGAWKKALPGVLAFLMTAAACAYFGVTPGAFWLLLILSLAALTMLTKLDWRAFAAVMVCAAVIAGLALWLAPGENARISALDDQLRDTLAFTTVTQHKQPENTPAPTPETQPEQENKEPMLLQIRESMDAKTIILIVLIAAILLILFVPAVIRDRLQKRRDQNRAGMDSADHAEAIRATFRYAMLWLRAANRDEKTAPGYDAAYRLWQEAAFSDHAMSDAQREQMTAFQRRVSDAIESEAGRLQSWKLRVRNAL